MTQKKSIYSSIGKIMKGYVCYRESYDSNEILIIKIVATETAAKAWQKEYSKLVPSYIGHCDYGKLPGVLRTPGFLARNLMNMK
jgi:hypothetical protein